MRAAGSAVRFIAVGDRLEALTSHAAIRLLLEDRGRRSHLRRVAMMQLRIAEKKARGNG